MDRFKYRDILYNDAQLGPYPDHLLKRVSAPTNRIPGQVERRSERETVSSKTLAGEFGEDLAREFKRSPLRYPLLAALLDLQLHVAAYGKERVPVAAKRAPLPDDPRVMSRHLKALGYSLGADQVRIGPVAASAVYYEDGKGEPVEVPYKCAIVFAARRDACSLSASSGWDDIVNPLTYAADTKLALWMEVIVNYLRRLGIDAMPTYARNYLTLMPRLALDAGMGELSRLGIILNPFFGCNCRYAAVLVDLDLETDGYVDFGLQDYCATCTICAEQCPSRAIPRGQQILYNGYYTWKLNARVCSDFHVLNREGTLCSRCTKVCPWNRPEMEPSDWAEWDGSLAWLHETVDRRRAQNAAADFVDLRESTDKWWFHLEERDGEIIVPTDKNKQRLCREYPIQE
jgi:epoxyqueuosine reductase